MEQLLYKSTVTTPAIRKAIQESNESISRLVKRYGIGRSTVVKWKNRSDTEDRKLWRRNPKSTVLSRREEVAIVAFRKHTLLSLDECFVNLKRVISKLTRSSLYRCLKRHDIGKLL